jgi:hypothetical protein
MKITIHYFDGCPHWKLSNERVRHVLKDVSRDDVTIEYQFVDSPETAERIGFLGSPTILVDGRDPFANGTEEVGTSCRVFRTEDGVQGTPSLAQLRRFLAGPRSNAASIFEPGASRS